MQPSLAVGAGDGSDPMQDQVAWMREQDVVSQLLRSNLHHKQYVEQVCGAAGCQGRCVSPAQQAALPPGGHPPHPRGRHRMPSLRWRRVPCTTRLSAAG